MSEHWADEMDRKNAELQEELKNSRRTVRILRDDIHGLEDSRDNWKARAEAAEAEAALLKNDKALLQEAALSEGKRADELKATLAKIVEELDEGGFWVEGLMIACENFQFHAPELASSLAAHLICKSQRLEAKP